MGDWLRPFQGGKETEGPKGCGGSVADVATLRCL
jgi:hypothetical protein